MYRKSAVNTSRIGFLPAVTLLVSYGGVCPVGRLSRLSYGCRTA
jgi:hypothetical protein